MARYALTERKGKTGGSQSGDTSESASGQLIDELVVAEQEIKEAGHNEKDDEIEPPKKAKTPTKAKTQKGGRPAKKGAAAEEEHMDIEDVAAAEEKPTESKKNNPTGKKPAAAKKSEASDDGDDDYVDLEYLTKPTPRPITLPRRTAKTAAKEKIVAEFQEERNRKVPEIMNHRITAPPQLFGPYESKPPPAKRFHSNEVALEQIPTPSSTQIQTRKSKLYDSFTDKEFHDVIFTASDGTKITTHRCVLAKYSPILRDIFKKNTVIPVPIDAKDYTPTTIQAALDFMFEKRDSIIGKEFNLLKFASQFGINDLQVVCSKNTAVTPSNVFDYIQIAYSNNLEEMKRKCLTILVEKRKEIDAIKFADLPKNIHIDFARF